MDKFSTLKIGDKAPDFELTDQYGQLVRLSNLLKTQEVLLVFYPHDQTPLCTHQLRCVNEQTEIAHCNVKVVGINYSDQYSHQKFSTKKKLALPLLTDRDYRVSEAYNALFHVGPFKLIRRTVVGISQDNTIRYYERGMPQNRHILQYIGSCVQPKPKPA